MKKKYQSINKIIIPIIFLGIVVFIWQCICWSGQVPKFMLPSPLDVCRAFNRNFKLLFSHTMYTLVEAFLGLTIGVLVGVFIALLMDRFKICSYGFRPILVITQTIPTVAIAPLLVLWFGVYMTPKIILVALTTFFPIAIGLHDAYVNVDHDLVDLMRSMGASRLNIYKHVKIPASMPNFFSALKISVTYSIVAAVIAEWLGGIRGIGVYMIRMKKGYSFAAMFAAIFMVSVISLILIVILDWIKKIVIKWDRRSEKI